MLQQIVWRFLLIQMIPESREAIHGFDMQFDIYVCG